MSEYPLLKTFFPSCSVATYTPQRVQRYKGNPLIEALGPVKSIEQAVDDLKRGSPTPADDYSEEIEDDLNTRIGHLQQLYHFIFPQRHQVEFVCALDLLIRNGYVGRAPNTKDHFEIFAKINAAERSKLEHFDSVNFNGMVAIQLCDALIGYSGAGKTQTIKLAQASMPEVIFHPETNVFQIPCLIVEAVTGGPAAVLTEIISEFDRTLPHLHYRRDYIDRSRPMTVVQLLCHVARLCTLHCVGVLIIEEIQKLEIKNRTDQVLLNQILTISNLARVPVLFTGTNMAASRLWSDGALARRSSGLPPWERLSLVDHYDEFEAFLCALLQFQWLPVRLEYSFELAEHVFHLTQGIIDAMKQLYIFAQTIAILDGAPMLTLEHFTRAYSRYLNGFHDVLDALRSGNPSKINAEPHYAPVSLEENERMYRARAFAKIPEFGMPTRTNNQEAGIQIAASLLAADHPLDEAIKIAKAAAQEVKPVNVSETVVKALGSKRTRKPSQMTFADRPEDYRREVYLAKIEETSTAYQLQKSGKIKKLLEILSF